MTFILDERLQRDCHFMTETKLCQILLLDNAFYYWFVLVPKVEEIELHEVSDLDQKEIFSTLMRLSRFVKTSFNTDKVNIGAIGNIVSQLHIHVVGRRIDDTVWPAVVWGAKPKKSYAAEQLEKLRQLVIQSI